ncbi:MAG: histidine phosphatase family protein [Pseudomonadota bacterium]
MIRHPVTAAPPGLCYGRTDPGLGPDALGQIERAVALLEGCMAIVTSPLPRCMALAEALAAANGAALRTDPRLAEIDFGAWEGRLWDAISRTESDPWAADPWSVAPPGGETFADVHARVGAALADVVAGAVVVTHAGVIRAARMIVEGATFGDVFAEPVPYAEPMRLGRKAA